MPLAKLEAELRPIARERIAMGQLPRETPTRMWGGKGTGQVCALCDKAIERDEVEFEVEHRIGETAQMLRFHLVCESIWQLETARAAQLSKQP
jgi:hypothetical protein